MPDLGDRRLSALTAESDPACIVHGCRWLRAGRITLLTGREGAGKSTVARQIAAATTTGNHWLGADQWPAEQIDPGQVVWISGDEPPGRVAREFKRFDAAYGDYHPDGIHAYTVDDFDRSSTLHSVLMDIRPSLVVVDPLMMLVRPERDDYRMVYDAIREWLPYRLERAPRPMEDDDPLPEVDDDTFAGLVADGYIDETGQVLDDGESMLLPAVLALHHQHRDREMRTDSVSRYLGSVAWGAAVDCVTDLTRPDKADNTRALAVGKSRFSDVRACTTEWLDYDDSLTYGYVAGKQPAAKLAPAGVDAGMLPAVRVWRAQNPTGTKTACACALGIPRGSASKRYQSLTRVWGLACDSV